VAIQTGEECQDRFESIRTSTEGQPISGASHAMTGCMPNATTRSCRPRAAPERGQRQDRNGEVDRRTHHGSSFRTGLPSIMSRVAVQLDRTARQCNTIDTIVTRA
jgi:hypothetical protein